MRTKLQIIAETLTQHETRCGGPDGYSEIIDAELAKRLTERNYLTCEDFDHFDVKCCGGCHDEPHYEMIDVILDDGAHAWVCCAIHNILIRRLPAPTTEEERHAGRATQSDEEKLYYCLLHAHRESGRKRGHKKLTTLVQRALIRPGKGPARGCNTSNRPKRWGFCMLCGASLYPENAIPGTYFHNCKKNRELTL